MVIYLSIFSNLSGKGLNKKRDIYCDEASAFVSVHFVQERRDKQYSFRNLPLKTDADRDRCEKWYQEHDNPNNFMEIVFLYLQERKIKVQEICKEYELQASLFNETSTMNNPVEKWQAIAICFGLDLNLAEARVLLKTVGYSLSNSSKSDLIIRYCFENDIYELSDINYILQTLCNIILKQIPSEI